MKWLDDLMRKIRQSELEERRLQEEVKKERVRFEAKRRRVQRVLDEFHHVDGVIKTPR